MSRSENKKPEVGPKMTKKKLRICFSSDREKSSIFQISIIFPPSVTTWSPGLFSKTQRGLCAIDLRKSKKFCFLGCSPTKV